MFEKSWFYVYPGMDNSYDASTRQYEQRNLSHGPRLADGRCPQRDDVILQIFGTPDIRQIDGLGGGDLLTSKCAIIGPSSRPDADVDYTFARVALDKALVNRKEIVGISRPLSVPLPSPTRVLCR